MASDWLIVIDNNSLLLPDFRIKLKIFVLIQNTAHKLNNNCYIGTDVMTEFVLIFGISYLRIWTICEENLKVCHEVSR